MAQTTPSQPISTQVSTTPVRGHLSAARSLALRRLLAWGLEVGLVAGSAALPWGLGEALRQSSGAETVPLNGAVTAVRGAIARPLGWSRQQLVREVPPLTNLLWFSAVVLPVAIAGSQIYGLATQGKTWPKGWLGVQVMADHASPPAWALPARLAQRPAAGPRGLPGLGPVVVRELGRWGVPLAGAYLLWVGSGLFPNQAGLAGLTLATGLGAGATCLGDRGRRAWYDRLAGTQVVLLRGGHLPDRHRPDRPGADPYAPIDGESTASALANPPLVGLTTEEYGGLTAIVLSPAESAQVLAPQGWRRHLPLAGALGGVVVLGGLGALWLDRRLPPAQGAGSDALFLALVENLSQNATSFSDRQAAALALASSQDPRAIPLLVDMLAQTADPALLDTLQQGLVTLGPPAIPPLQRLNVALANDLLALPPEQRLVPQLRQRTVKRTLAKILVLHSGQLNGADLSGTQLGYVVDGPDTFTLMLENQHLAGITWRNALLFGARFRKAKFFDPGPDGRPDTFDDWVSDFSGSDLTEASLVAAHLRHAVFRNTSLLRANLSNAQAAYADFSGANASSAWLIAADLSHSRFDGTSLVGADLTDADLTGASLVEVRLRQGHLAGAELAGADLSRADLAEARLAETNLTGANLAGANLSDSHWPGATLTGANLTGANLAGANLAGANLTGANLTGANLAGASFFVAERSQPQSFVAVLTDPAPAQGLVGVDFSKALNLRGEQLEYLCRQGGIHPSCRPQP